MTEIGLLAYPGWLLGAVYGITDLFRVADGKCAEHGVPEAESRKGSRGSGVSQDTVNEIAWKVGYEDPAAFRKIFRRLIGLSPKDYRQRFRPELLAAR